MFGKMSFTPYLYSMREREAFHTESHLRCRMSSRSVSGCTGRHGFQTKRTRQRLAMEIVSCSAPITPGQSPPSPRPSRSCRAHQEPRNRLAGNKVQEEVREAAE
ncbi:unnamed protein product [Strongylus vulgaris]|uniref:Uncharacterized protein n=1 Tax=Strongylus vulgaris TaxID=40348 RepID=A0A3P7JIK8_STRVU|nr:unnamed protein product [Strongylus vulgaris]